MGRAFEFRKARKLKRWGNMAKTFTRLGKQIAIAVSEGGPDPDSNSHLRAIESGQVSPTVVTICKICSVLECDTSQLFIELDDILKAKRARQRGNH